MNVVHILPGPRGHGVVRHGHALAAALERQGLPSTVVRGLRPVADADLVHLQFTDSVLPGDVLQAAAAVEAWAGPLPLVVTMHDVPGHDPDASRDARRRVGYARVAALADAVVVSAPHELAGAGPGARLVRLPVEPLAAPGDVPAWADRPTVGVLGFVYPGKGHAQVLAAADGARVVFLGAASPGHDDLLTDLRRQADRTGVDLVITGPLSDADLHAAALAVTVPVAAYTTLGASGSLATWNAAGRRPVVTRSRLTEDLDRDEPGTVVLVDDLGPGVRRALGEGSTTWLAGPAQRRDVAAEHVEVYRSVLA